MGGKASLVKGGRKRGGKDLRLTSCESGTPLFVSTSTSPEPPPPFRRARFFSLIGELQ